MKSGCTGTHLENIWNNTGQNRTSSSNVAQSAQAPPIYGIFGFAQHPSNSRLVYQIPAAWWDFFIVGTYPQKPKFPQLT